MRSSTGFPTPSGSAHAAQRPQCKQLLAKIRSGATLVVAKLDRLGRNAPDVLATIKRLAELKVKVIVIQLGKLDLGSPAGKLMLAADAEMEHDLLVERTQAGLARAKAEGKTLGRPPKTNQKQRTAMVEARIGAVIASAACRGSTTCPGPPF